MNITNSNLRSLYVALRLLTAAAELNTGSGVRKQPLLWPRDTNGNIDFEAIAEIGRHAVALADIERTIRDISEPKIIAEPKQPTGHGEGASHSLQRHSVGPPYPWMIVGTGIDAEYHYAYNGVTGERHPARLSYASALSDIGGLTKLRGLRRQDDDGVSTEPKGRIGESVTAMAERQTRDRDALRLVQPKPGDIDYTTPGPCPRRAATNYHEVPSPTGVRYTAPRVGAQYTLTLADAIELGLTHADELAASGGYPTRGIKSWAVLGAGAQTVEGLKAMPVWERLRYCDEVLMQFPSEQISRAIAWESDGAGVPEIVTALRQVFK